MNKRPLILAMVLGISVLLVALCYRTWRMPVGSKNRVAAEAALAEAEQLRKEWKAEIHKRAIRKYEEARAYWQTVGDWKKEAVTLRKIGEAYDFLNERQKAIDYYNQALSIYQKANDRQEEGEVLNHIGYSYLYSGKPKDALELCSKALTLSREFGNRRGEADALNKVGEVYYFLGDLLKSVSYYQQALPIWLALNDLKGQAQTLVLFGHVYTGLSDTQKARESFNQTLPLWQSLNDRPGQAVTLIALGQLNALLGERQQAISFYNQAMQLVKPMGNYDLEARALSGLGFTYDELGNKQIALSYYEQALKLFQAAGIRKGESSQLWKIGETYISLGDSQKALKHLQDGLSMIRAMNDQRVEPYMLRDIGVVYESLGDKTKAISYYNQALLLNRAGKNRRQEAYVLDNLGQVHRYLGKKQKALDYFNQALALSQATEDSFEQSLTLYHIAQTESDSNNLTAARSRIEDSLGIIESLRTKVASQDLRTSYFSSIHQQYEFYVNLLMQLHKKRPSEGFGALALETSERMCARSLLELLAESRTDIRQGINPRLLERERSLKQSLNDKAGKQTQILSRNHTEEEAAGVVKEIQQLTTEYDQLKGQIRNESPRYAALTQPQPIIAKEIQLMLDDDTMLLEYSLGEKRSYVWVVTPTEVKSYELPGRAEIDKAAREVYKILAPPENSAVQSDSQRKAEFNQKAAALSQLILKPVANELGNKRLVIVADGILQYIPFSVLPKPQTAKLNGQSVRDSKTGTAANPIPMIYDHEIVNLPSASTLAVLRRETAGRKPAPKAVAVMADPVFETSDLRLLPIKGNSYLATLKQAASDSLAKARESLTRGGSFKRLYGTLEEARAIEELTKPYERLIAKDFDADLKRATSQELSQYRIIHFATHGVLDSDNPNLSALVFSLFDKQGKPQNGYLYLHDIYNLNLPAELVVLSACDTALGKEFKGEGLVGLTRGFMYAGAPRVMASLWKVGDEPTAKLMREFYRYHLKDGLPPAAALRQAQIKLYQDADWNAPYYWGSFVLQGEWK